MSHAVNMKCKHGMDQLVHALYVVFLKQTWEVMDYHFDSHAVDLLPVSACKSFNAL